MASKQSFGGKVGNVMEVTSRASSIMTPQLVIFGQKPTAAPNKVLLILLKPTPSASIYHYIRLQKKCIMPYEQELTVHNN